MVTGMPPEKPASDESMISMNTMPDAPSSPVTMLLVAALYFGQQVYDIIFVHDNVANFMHIVGGLCGTAFGYYSALHSRRRPAKAVKFSSTNSRRKR